MTKLGVWKKTSAVFMLCAAMAIAASAQTFTTVQAFDAANGANPSDALIQGTDGNFYGTTSRGGFGSCQQLGCGTVFQVFGGIASFVIADGEFPDGALVQASDGSFYGTSSAGGTNDGGTIFKVTPKGKIAALYDFCAQPNCPDGYFTVSTLVQGADGNLYGTTPLGGDISCNGGYGCGTVFKTTLQGKFTTVHSFTSADGALPQYEALVQGSDGAFYGTTTEGGANESSCRNGCGTVFKITSVGTLTTLYSFCSQDGCLDGSQPYAGLVLGVDGDFYGTTSEGGSTASPMGAAAQSSRSPPMAS